MIKLNQSCVSPSKQICLNLTNPLGYLVLCRSGQNLCLIGTWIGWTKFAYRRFLRGNRFQNLHQASRLSSVADDTWEPPADRVEYTFRRHHPSLLYSPEQRPSRRNHSSLRRRGSDHWDSYYCQKLSRIHFDILFDLMIVARCTKHIDHNKNA